MARIEAATGLETSPGLVVLVDDATPARVDAVADRLGDVPGVAVVTPGGQARDGSSAIVLGTIAADATSEDVAADAVDAFADDPDVTVGGGAVAGLQIGEQVGEDLGRAELMAFPVLLVLSLLIFGGRAALLPLVVGVTTVLGTFLALAGVNEVYGLSVFALNLVIGLGLGLAIDYTLFLLTRYREELDRQGPTRRRRAHHDGHRRPHRRLLRRHRRGRPGHPHRLPARLPEVDGHRRRHRRGRRRRRLARHHPRHPRPVGRQARPPPRTSGAVRGPLVPPVPRRDAPPRRRSPRSPR